MSRTTFIRGWNILILLSFPFLDTEYTTVHYPQENEETIYDSHEEYNKRTIYEPEKSYNNLYYPTSPHKQKLITFQKNDPFGLKIFKA